MLLLPVSADELSSTAAAAAEAAATCCYGQHLVSMYSHSKSKANLQ